ncbi:protein of unknown function [Magnetospirillum sp. XM-1]|nr:protein of unknown function [Magnetospirillum sp. XM-1]
MVLSFYSTWCHYIGTSNSTRWRHAVNILLSGVAFASGEASGASDIVVTTFQSRYASISVTG